MIGYFDEVGDLVPEMAGVGEEQGSVEPVREKTGDYFNPSGFQIWSIGPDGINNDGEGDDICSWKTP